MFEDIIYLKFIPPGILLSLKIIFIIIFLSFLAVILYSLRKSSWLRYRFLQDLIEISRFRPYEAEKLSKTWAKVQKRLEIGSESEYKLAVIEADSLLNEVLERMGYRGGALGERLQKVTADALPNVEEVWEAHKIRNNIVHDPDYRLSLDEAKRALEIYEKALTDLQAF
jgi:hypothetical protein